MAGLRAFRLVWCRNDCNCVDRLNARARGICVANALRIKSAARRTSIFAARRFGAPTPNGYAEEAIARHRVPAVVTAADFREVASLQIGARELVISRAAYGL